MLGGASYPVDEAVAAYALWWREAGFHTATSDAAHDWREAPAAVPVPAAPSRAEAAPRPGAPALPPRQDGGPLPETLPAFLDWLRADMAQPEAPWTGPAFLPDARPQPPLLLVLDVPGAEPAGADMPLDAGQLRFVTAMLAAIGRTIEDVALASLAMRRPVGGLIDEDVLDRLGGRMRHYLALSRPGAAILIGDRTSRALLGAPAPAQPPRLGSVNHAGGTVPAIALPALDLLMSRPAIKARSWQTLRLLNGVLH